MATSALNPSRGTPVPASKQEPIAGSDTREINLLVAGENLSIIETRYGAQERVAGPHIHAQHTDAFYVLEGDLTFQIGSEAETFTIGAGGFVAVPPSVAHSFRTGSRPARWLTIHAPDGGFAAFMRGTRDGVHVEWDIAPVPADGGPTAERAIVSLPNEAVRQGQAAQRALAAPSRRRAGASARNPDPTST